MFHRVAFVLLGLVVLFGTGSFFFLQDPASRDSLEKWWEGFSTSVVTYGGSTKFSMRANDDDDKDDDEVENDTDKFHAKSHATHSAQASSTTWQSEQHGTQPHTSNQKYPFMPTASEIDDDNRICYVNVGKTAGSSAACRLGFVFDACPVERVRIAPGHLAPYTTSMLHTSVNGCRDDTFAWYLFVVRDPLERLKTWFAYERPRQATATTVSASSQQVTSNNNPDANARKKLLFVDCPFSTLNDLGGEFGLGGNNATMCSQRAWQAVLGTKAYSEHNYYNYGYYWNQVTAMSRNSRLRILVLRTEHLSDDWKAIEMNILHGTDPFRTNASMPERHAPYRQPQDSMLSTESQDNICRALCTEIQVYKQLLARAENLDRDQYATSMRELRKACPDQAIYGQCN
jgi:hypothetical protein